MNKTTISRRGFIEPVSLSLLALGAMGVFTYKNTNDIRALRNSDYQQESQLVELRTGLNQTREVVNKHSERLDNLEGYCYPSGNTQVTWENK